MQASLRAAAARSHEVVQAPPFTLFLDPREPLRFHNYAIPDGDVAPAPREIESLQAAFRLRERLPRLEWVEETAPRLAAALAAAGMVEELRTPLMACAAEDLQEAGANVEGLTVGDVGDDDLHDTANVMRVAFGGTPLTSASEVRDPRAAGGGAVLARAGGAPVSAAGWTSVVDGISEIVGVATAEAWRGRGLAGLVTAAASRAAFRAGASLCILSPGDDKAQRVYARAGFRRAATMLHWSDPD